MRAGRNHCPGVCVPKDKGTLMMGGGGCWAKTRQGTIAQSASQGNKRIRLLHSKCIATPQMSVRFIR